MSKLEKFVGSLRLNKDEKVLYRAGIINGTGTLTNDGVGILLTFVLQDYQKKLADFVRANPEDIKDEANDEA